MPQALLEFLAAGDKPIAFTPGSAMWRGEKFFAAAVDLCQRLGRRGILLSRSKGHIPRKMPANMIHIRYAPFSELLPRVAALVHHGGIGTTSQALAVGVPQMIVAMSHDQPDNGHRIQKLGVGVVTTPKKFYATSNSARELTMLLDPAEVLARCEAVARRFDGKETFRDAIHWIEALRAGDTSPA
jgi:UDP:flavonoid glycosyltransferase YjiC (YdhE family)